VTVPGRWAAEGPLADSDLLGGHVDRPVVRRRRSGRLVAVKCYRQADGAQVHAEHQLLWASPLGEDRDPPGVPEPLGWNPIRRELSMEYVPGPALGARGDLGTSALHLDQTARLLADLHACGVKPRRRRTAERVLRSLRRKADDLDGGPAERAAYLGVVDLLGALAQRRRLSAVEREVASHGDFSPRNVLVSPDGVRMIDFDRLQLAGAGRDVAYWGAWAWATPLLGGGSGDWTVGNDFTAAYLVHRPVAADELAHSGAFHRAAALLRIAHGWSALARRPGVRAAVVAEAARLASGRGRWS
jgi:Ser/Thr protein kinase RdoA (MazF antagonist)